MEPCSWRRHGSEDIARVVSTGHVQLQLVGAWGLKARSPDRRLRGRRHEVCKQKAETEEFLPRRMALPLLLPSEPPGVRQCPHRSHSPSESSPALGLAGAPPSVPASAWARLGTDGNVGILPER